MATAVNLRTAAGTLEMGRHESSDDDGDECRQLRTRPAMQ